MDLAQLWPPFGLELRTPRLRLRPIRDEDLPGLCAAALQGVHDPTRTPFSVPWTDAPADALPIGMARYHWGLRAGSAPESWNLEFAVIRDDEVLGAQGVTGRQFAVRRTVSTGSWLTQTAHGQGIGREMREGVLQFAFDVLGADRAESAAKTWNAASRTVSRKLGYTEDGLARVVSRPGIVEDEVRMRLDRDDFVRPSWTLHVDGFTAAAREWFGVPADTSAQT